MNVFWLGSYQKNLDDFLHSKKDKTIFTEEPLAADSRLLDGQDFLVSYGYRYLVTRDILKRFPKRAINLHISYLPWNRGADPNLWSFLEDTPKGVSIHYMTEKLDAGDILCQEKVNFASSETLRTSYDSLLRTAEDLFRRFWVQIKEGRIEPRPQARGGSFHLKKDAEVYNHLLEQGWDTPIDVLIGKAKCHA
jgi:methionyl-tRNA formyltransferase